MSAATPNGRDAILQANTDARRLIKQALALDEQGDAERAVPLYQECCRILLAGMSVDTSRVSRDQADVHSLSAIQQKMAQLFDNASSRLKSSESVVPTPQYTETAEDTSAQESLVRRTEADLILTITRGVRMLCTAGDGTVTERQGHLDLKIFLFPSASGSAVVAGAPAFLQCGSWVYPLIPGCSPIFKASPHSYTFPDVEERPNPFGISSGGTPQGMAYVTIVLEPSVDAGLVLQLSQTLATLANVQDHSGVTAMSALQPDPTPAYSASSEAGTASTAAASTTAVVPFTSETAVQPAEATPSWANYISSGISAGASMAYSVLGVTAQLADKAVQAGSQEIRKRMDTTENVQMSEATKTAVRGAKVASKAAVVVSDQVVSAVSMVTKALADQFVPIAVEKLSTSSDGTPRDPVTQARINGAVQVGSAGVAGVVQVYRGLEHAAKTVGRSVHKATVETVKHRYGAEAGDVAEGSMSTLGNVVVASHNIDNVGIKAIAKKTAVHAGRRTMESMNGTDGQEVAASNPAPSVPPAAITLPPPRPALPPATTLKPTKQPQA